MSGLEIPTLAFLVDMTQKASREAADIFRQPSLLDTKWKADNTPVTAGDLVVHAAVVEIFAAAYPQIPNVGEEGSAGTRTHQAGEYWVSLDPIDGTGAFRRGIPMFTTMLALMCGNEVTMGVIHDPIMQRTYSAQRGRGAFLNDVPIHTRVEPTDATIGVAVWPGSGRSDMVLPRMVSGVMRELHDRGHRFAPAWSIGYNDALVASGMLAGSVFAGDSTHDTAAGDIIVREAGGIATDLWGRPLSYDGQPVNGHVVSCNAAIHDEILEVVRRHDNRPR